MGTHTKDESSSGIFSMLEHNPHIAQTKFFENGDRAVFVYEDQSITETMHVLWENQIGVVADVQRETKRLIGCVRNSDLHLLLDNNDLFNNRKTLTMENFIHMDGGKVDSDPTIERDLRAFLSAGVLTLGNNFLQRMDSPQVQGVLTLRDMIIQFAPALDGFKDQWRRWKAAYLQSEIGLDSTIRLVEAYHGSSFDNLNRSICRTR
ncbi:hypothetical protein ACSBR2_001745 [Camellia fascicularis]